MTLFEKEYHENLNLVCQIEFHLYEYMTNKKGYHNPNYQDIALARSAYAFWDFRKSTKKKIDKYLHFSDLKLIGDYNNLYKQVEPFEKTNAKIYMRQFGSHGQIPNKEMLFPYLSLSPKEYLLCDELFQLGLHIRKIVVCANDKMLQMASKEEQDSISMLRLGYHHPGGVFYSQLLG